MINLSHLAIHSKIKFDFKDVKRRYYLYPALICKCKVGFENPEVFAMKPLRKSLLTFLLATALFIVVYSAVFLFLMASVEGRSYTIIDAVYWVIATMTTQGLGLSLIHISEPTRLLSISYAVFCLKKKKKKQ